MAEESPDLKLAPEFINATVGRGTVLFISVDADMCAAVAFIIFIKVRYRVLNPICSFCQRARDSHAKIRCRFYPSLLRSMGWGVSHIRQLSPLFLAWNDVQSSQSVQMFLHFPSKSNKTQSIFVELNAEISTEFVSDHWVVRVCHPLNRCYKEGFQLCSYYGYCSLIVITLGSEDAVPMI